MAVAVEIASDGCDQQSCGEGSVTETHVLDIRKSIRPVATGDCVPHGVGPISQFGDDIVRLSAGIIGRVVPRAAINGVVAQQSPEQVVPAAMVLTPLMPVTA